MTPHTSGHDPFANMTDEASRRHRDAMIRLIPSTLSREEYERRWKHECEAHLSRTWRTLSKEEQDAIDAEEKAYREQLARWSRRIDAQTELERRLWALAPLPAFIGEGI